ncbi:alpha/beta hydrolase [Ancylobacter sp. VNQ12]|uniref:alpha/beta hydrolase n=1 Tax=Ancylobacter sp. VNQ12 TaxID=3400920 RepID=UPI003C0A4FEE
MTELAFTVGAKSSLLAIVMLCVLAGCADRPGPELLRDSQISVPGAHNVTVYVATTRQRDPNDQRAFTSERASRVSYGEYTISIPPNHRPGNIEWPTRHIDPARHFTVVSSRTLDRGAFEREVGRQRGGQLPDVGVFVHGYNTNFQEALFRMAQMTADAGIEDAAPILFAWPSEGSIAGYVADKDAVTYSRDELVALLVRLAAQRTRGATTVVGHSMGGWLTAEALRQLRLTGKDGVVARLQVILAAPDIDIDVFRAQIGVIGRLSPPLAILVSRDDLALRASQLLTIERPRLGTLDVNDPGVEEVTRAAGVQVVDISDLTTADAFRHDRFAALATLYPKLSGRNADGRNSGLRQAGAFVFNAVGATISSPFVLAGRVVGGE